ncbi:MAG TPA: prenyltransferase/squalene oxidase repeat-containing protein, partial [Candidatus Polarisedimenticolia bacterium]|nr:prenyltransferase/squalene oxidase repeat-containing protein [Candidatus Polarisedimenticolia bacterium]
SQHSDGLLNRRPAGATIRRNGQFSAVRVSRVPVSNDPFGAQPGLRDALSRALAWQTTPPIKVDRPGSPAHGAILHGFDTREGKPLGAYTEITGYGISLFAFLQRTRGDTSFNGAARAAADYLLSVQTSDGAYPHLPDPASPSARGPLYAFDTGVCIVGMARLAKASKEARDRESVLAAGKWLLGMQRGDGSFSSMQREDGVVVDPGGFYGDGSCIHAKNAIALLELHALSGGEQWREAAVRACDHVLTLQAPDGAFWSVPDRRYVFTHAHCYACEGLLFAGELLGEERFTAAARRGIAWLAATQQAEGGWLSHYKASLGSPRRMLEVLSRPMPSDAAAQAARLFALSGEEHESHRRSAIGFLLGCQDRDGGFFYRRTRFGYTPVLYTWSAQFAVQALEWSMTTADVRDLF